MLFFDHRGRDGAASQMRTTPEGMLIVHAVMDRLIGKGSLVEVLLLDPWKGATSDIEAEYDLAALGEVEDIHGPFCNPPRWMVSYREKVSADHGDRIQPKKQNKNAASEIQQTRLVAGMGEVGLP